MARSMKVFTLGRYPKRDTSDTMISAIGIASLIGVVLIVVAIAKLSGE